MTMSLVVKHFDDLLSTPEDVEQLKRAILKLAVQGKLVIQNPNDGSVKDVFGQLDKLPETIEDSDAPYSLPINWEWAYLTSVCDKTQDGTHFSPKVQYQSREKGTYLYITSKNIKEDGVDLSNVSYIDADVHRNIYKRCNPEKGDVLLIKDGAMTGVVTINNLDEEFTLLSSVALIKTNKKVLLPEYLKVFLRSPIGFEMITGKMSGSAIPRIVMNRLDKTLIAIPPLAEQRRIVARVEELFAQTRALAKELEHSQIELDGLNKSALAHLLASETPEDFNQHWDFIAEHFDLLFQTPEHVAPLRQSILELAVRGKLTRREAGDESAGGLLKKISNEKEKIGKPASLRKVSEEEKPFDLPQGWEWARWDDVSLQIGDVDHKMPDEIPDGIPYISPRDFTGKEDILFATAKKISRKDYEDLAEKIKPERGDIIFPRYGTIGVNRFVSVDFEFLASYSCSIIKHMKGLMNPRYVFFYSISPFLQQETQKYVNKTTQPNVGIKSIQQFLFPLPPLAEQERIVKRVEQLLSLCDALEGRLQSAEEERGRLVAAVMSTVGG